jgi:hypothetical protein
MKKDPLPAEFVVYVKRLMLHPSSRSPRYVWRWLILRWGFWLDGVTDNALPGYATCPKPTERTGYPAGWSYQKFHAIAREAIGTPAIHQARKRAAATRIDCGSDHPYGICPDCGKGHGYQVSAPTLSSAI